MRLFRKRLPPAGSVPGTLPDSSGSVVIRSTHYGPTRYEAHELESLDELDDAGAFAADGVIWLDVEGLGDAAAMKRIAARFELHPLLLEDIVQVPQRPQVRSYPGALSVITRMLRFDPERGLDAEQVSLVLIDNVLISFQERPGDVFEPVRRRLRDNAGKLRQFGTDYLLYALLDAVVDAYYPALERIGDKLEDTEDAIMLEPTPEDLRQVTSLKSDLLAMRRAIWPQRESLATLTRDDLDGIDPAHRMFFRDVYDHAVQSADVVESYRELASGLQNTYLTVVANRTNDVMKVLTIIASIFIPLTFLAGIYGMNFEVMPELKVRYGYPILLATMIAIATGLVVWFRRKQWL